jgi:hypothetical protein
VRRTHGRRRERDARNVVLSHRDILVKEIPLSILRDPSVPRDADEDDTLAQRSRRRMLTELALRC